MRVGILCPIDQLDWAERLGFRAVEWVWFAESPAGPSKQDWKPFASEIAAKAKSADIRISAIGAFYRNPLDPLQMDTARATVRRAIDVAAHVGAKTVSAFAGAVIETEINERGGNPVYRPLENYIPRICAFWSPLARYAADNGVRLAFENCPQGRWRLPIMNYNVFGQPAIWEAFFNEIKEPNVGIEWDPAHLLCQFIDPIANLRKFVSRVFHVHAKDARINHGVVREFGVCHPDASEHCLPGRGQVDWPGVVGILRLSGYDSDLNIEGAKKGVTDEADLLDAKKLIEQCVG